MSDLTIKGLLEEREKHYKSIDSIDAELNELGVRFCTDSRLQLYRGIEKISHALESDVTKGYHSKEYPYRYETGGYVQIENEELQNEDN